MNRNYLKTDPLHFDVKTFKTSTRQRLWLENEILSVVANVNTMQTKLCVFVEKKKAWLDNDNQLDGCLQKS